MPRCPASKEKPPPAPAEELGGVDQYATIKWVPATGGFADMPKSWGKGKPAEVAFRIRTALDRGDLPRFAATSNRDAVSAQFTLFKVC